jgi:CheY-like chemotaxis protein
MTVSTQTDINKVMLIDDNETDLFIQQRVLHNAGFGKEVFSYSSPLEALKYLQTNPPEKWPDIIFLDLNMPVMNGFMFLIEFGNFSSSIKKNCPIVILSSSNNPRDKEELKGNNDVLCFLTKPLNEKELNGIRSR